MKKQENINANKKTGKNINGKKKTEENMNVNKKRGKKDMNGNRKSVYTILN